MPPEDTTPSMVENARKGNRQAFDSLVGECRVSLEGHVRARIGRSLRSQVDPEDVLQETYGRAWKSIKSFRGKDHRTLLGWFKGIAEHVILDLADRHRRNDVIYLKEPPDPGHSQPSPSKTLRREERFSRLHEALDSLSPEHREVVVLVRIEGLKIKEAAERMSRTPNAVMKLLTRALMKLKDAFGDTESLHLPPRRLDGAGGEGHEE